MVDDTMTELIDGTVAVPRATGRVVGPVRACLLVVAGWWTWYRRNWRATAASSVALPVLYLIAMGMGFGSQVHATAGLGGHSYLVYLAPGWLAASAVYNAAGESTYPILSGFRWQKHFYGITATPITPDQVVAGVFTWISLRLLASGAVYLVIAALIGALTGPGIVLSLLFAVLCGLAFAAPVVAYAATLEGEGSQFSGVFRFIVVPMSLFAGTMFPVTQLPAWVRPVAWLTPLWHGTELSRGAEFGTLRWWPALGHIAFLVAMFVIGWLIARAKFRARLAS